MSEILKTSDMPDTGICEEGGMNKYLDKLPFVTKCAFCDNDVRLAKNSLEGMKVACFEHSSLYVGSLK